MTSEPRSPAGKSVLLALLLWILHWVVLSFENLSRWLEKPRHYFGGLGGIKTPKKRVAKQRGSQPAFPATVAVIVAEQWAGGQTLDALATLTHWYLPLGIYQQHACMRTSTLFNFAAILRCILTRSDCEDILEVQFVRLLLPSLSLMHVL